MIKILHTGDFHIGASFNRFKNCVLAEQLLFSAIKNMVFVANSQNVDAILISGDTFDNQAVNFSLKTKLIDILKEFSGKIFVCFGNHDYYFTGSVWNNLELPENFVIFNNHDFECYDFSENIKIYGASFTNIFDSIKLPEIDENFINIGLVHSDILTKSQYNPYEKEEIAQSNFDYLALGHNHKFSGILKSGDTFYAASGNISATGMDEIGEKGFIIATIDKKDCQFEFVKSNGLEIHNTQIDLTNLETQDEFFDKIEKFKNQNIYYNIELCGINNCDIDVNSLNFSDFFFDYEITNNSKNKTEIWKYIEDDSLVGEFTRILKSKFDNEQNNDILTALDLGIDALL